MTEIDALLKEDRRFPPSAEWRRTATVNDPDVYRRAAADPEAFWAELARELDWIQPWSRVLEWKPPYAKWFIDGKLNIAANCVDRHVRTARRNKAAIIWEGEPGDRRTLTVLGPLSAGRRVRQRAQVAWREARRSRGALPADGARACDCDARVRADRRRAQRDLRRLQRGGAARSYQRREGGPARHRGRRLSARPDRTPQADGRRGAPRHAVHSARDRRPAIGRQPDPRGHSGGARSLVPPH